MLRRIKVRQGRTTIAHGCSANIGIHKHREHCAFGKSEIVIERQDRRWHWGTILVGLPAGSMLG